MKTIFKTAAAAFIIVFGVTTLAESAPMGSQFYKILRTEPDCKVLNSKNTFKFNFHDGSDANKTYQAQVAIDREFEMNPAGVLNVTSSYKQASFTVYFDNHNFSAFRGKSGPSCDEQPLKCKSILEEFVAILNQAPKDQKGVDCAMKLANSWKGALEAKYSSKLSAYPRSLSSESSD